MGRKKVLKFDTIGYWSEIKLDIVRKYASAYSKILAAQKDPKLHHIYVDAFSGPGLHISKTTGKYVAGSPLNALNVHPPFREYHLVDIDGAKVALLREIVRDRMDVHVHEGDCNHVLLKEVFPRVRWEDYRRGLCLLDPYGLDLTWDVISTAGRLKTIDIFVNFPVADMNRNVFWRNPDGVDESDISRMNAYWGDRSWRDVVYSCGGNLFGYPEKEDNETIAEGFRKRLEKVGGFEHVPQPLPMRNSKGATIYYLFFASQKLVARDILEDIFKEYRTRGMR